MQIGNGIIQGQYSDRTGNWVRNGHQVFVNGYFRLNYNEAQVEDALRRNTTVQEIRFGTLPYESNSGASIFNLMVSNNNFIRNIRPNETGVLSVGCRSIWGSPRMRVFSTVRAVAEGLNNTNRIPVATDLSIQDLKPSTDGNFIEIRVSGTYTAFPDLSTTDPVNTPPPMITSPPPPTIEIGSYVQINPTAQTWATGQNISPWVLGQTYRVNSLRNDNRELFLDVVNSWIRVEDVTLIN